MAIATSLFVFSALVLGELPSTGVAATVSNLAQVVASALAAAGCLGASRRAPDRTERRSWSLLGASALAWSMGQVTWTVLDATEVGLPYPSLADVGFLAAVLLALAGVLTLSSRSSTPTRLVAVLDGLIVAGGLLAIIWPLVLAERWRSSADETFAFALGLIYPVGNLVVASAILLVILRTGRERSAVPLTTIAASLLTLGTADAVFVWRLLQGTERDLSIGDIGWVAGHLLLLWAALDYPRTTAVRPRQGSRREDGATSLRRAIVPMSVAGLALAVRIPSAVDRTVDVDPFLNTVTATSVALILVRQLLTMLENRALTRSLEDKIEQLTNREEQLTHLALHDPLTGLANRRLFGDRVTHALARSRRTRERTAVLFLDLDDFKVVNDSLGHAAGDRLLEAVATRLTGCVRPGDTVSRLGGDEFGILLEDITSLEEVDGVTGRILTALEVAFPVGGRQVYTCASIGVAEADRDDLPDGDQLLADADVALYAAKAAGKATARRFEPAMRSTAKERLELGQDLRVAVDEGQFTCHYQPIVDLVTGRIVAMEALVRWHHPSRGLLAPGTFVEMAEETGAIGEIGRFVLRSAAVEAAGWRATVASARALELHVNLSGRQLEDPDLARAVQAELTASGFPAHLLVLEITESVAVDIAAHHLERLVELQALGVRLAIDDFGTGYSSLNYLRALPVEVLKIDRQFAQSVDGGTDTVLLEAIVQLGHSLGIEVVAEGIEREEQAATLRRMGCRRAQGFLFHPPVPASEIPGLLAAPIAAPRPDAGARSTAAD